MNRQDVDKNEESKSKLRILFPFQLFFILRKKNQHVSTLHVIHHGVMPFSVWMGVKFAPGGHSTFFALLNTFVHIVMYFYYMVAAMGPQFQKYIWWKKYLTTMQMVSSALISLCYGCKNNLQRPWNHIIIMTIIRRFIRLRLLHNFTTFTEAALFLYSADNSLPF